MCGHTILFLEYHMRIRFASTLPVAIALVWYEYEAALIMCMCGAETTILLPGKRRNKGMCIQTCLR
jgi:hypothetical protein